MDSNYWNKNIARQRLSRRRILGLVGGGVGSAALLAACGGGSSGNQKAAAPALDLGTYSPSEGAPQPGGRIVRWNGGGQPSFNPVQVYTEGTTLGGAYIYDRPLTGREDSRRYVLEAMETIETPDPLTVVMKLKPGMTYHDVAPVNGRAVKASDVVSGQQYVRDFPAAFDKTFAREYLASAEAPDDRTVVYHLKKPNAYLFDQTALGNANGQMIIPPETYDNLATGKQVGSGPYSVDSAQLNVGYVYKKFPRYRGAAKGLPYINETEIRFIPDAAAQEAAFRAGQLDIWSDLTPAQVASVPKDLGAKVRLAKYPAFQVFAFQLNMTRGFPWQSDVRVREAFWRLINRKQALDLALGGEGILGTGLVAVSHKEYQLDAKDTDPYWAEDVAKAKQLLAASGFDLTKDWPVISPQNESEVSQVLQQQFARGGIKTKIEVVATSGIRLQRDADNDWVIQTARPPGNDTPGQTLRNQHSKGWSDTFKGFALMDPEIDALIEKSEQTVDHDENVKLVKQAQFDAIKKYSSCYIMWTTVGNLILQSRVQNYELTLVNGVSRADMWLKQA